MQVICIRSAPRCAWRAGEAPQASQCRTRASSGAETNRVRPPLDGVLAESLEASLVRTIVEFGALRVLLVVDHPLKDHHPRPCSCLLAVEEVKNSFARPYVIQNTRKQA